MQTTKSPLRYERLGEWIYPGPLTLAEHQELHLRDTPGWIIGEALHRHFVAAEGPVLDAKKAIWDALSPLPWVGRYRIDEQPERALWSIRAELMGDLRLQYLLDLRAILSGDVPVTQIVRDYFEQQARKWMRAAYPPPEDQRA